MATEIPYQGASVDPRTLGGRDGYVAREADHCMNRCNWRRLYDSMSQNPASMTAEECAEVIEGAGEFFTGATSKCGLAAICIGLTAEKGEV